MISNEALGIAGVKTVTWGGDTPNVADYDVAVLDLVTLSKALQKGSIDMSKVKGPTADQVAQLQTANGMIVAILPPVTKIRPKRGTWLSPYWWCRMPLANLADEGTSVFVRQPRLRRYFDRGVRVWRSRPSLTQSGRTYKDGTSVQFKMEALVASRSDVPIAALTYWETYRKLPFVSLFGADPILQSTSGPVISLPETDKIPVAEAISIILQDLLLISAVTPPPVWSSEILLPGEPEARDALGGLGKGRDDIEVKIRQEEERLRAITRLKGLLYANGEELEECVWSALEALGAKVHESDTPGFEDRWFEDPVTDRRAVLEIKGHEGSMKKEDARQAEEWVTRWYEKRGEVVKGVLFGNPYRLLPPKDRPAPWPKELTNFAETKRLALVTTSQLIDALVRAKKGEASPKAFFDALFSAEGIVGI